MTSTQTSKFTVPSDGGTVGRSVALALPIGLLMWTGVIAGALHIFA